MKIFQIGNQFNVQPVQVHVSRGKISICFIFFLAVMKKGTSGSSIYKDFGRNDVDTARFDQCLDESTLDEPELQIKSVGDLLRIRQKEAIAESLKLKEAELLQKTSDVNDKLSESEIIQTYGSTTHSPIPIVDQPQIVDSKETPTKSSKDDEKGIVYAA